MSDALSSLRAALTPADGMRRLPMPLESFEHPSRPLSAKRLINLFAEVEPSDARSVAALIPTFGLQYEGEVFGAGPILAMENSPFGMYVVSGTHFYRLTQGLAGGAVIEDLGFVGSPSGADFAQNLMPTIATGVVGAVVCVPPNAYTCTHTGPLNQIGGTFPGARSVAYLDGYFVFTNQDYTSQFFVSLLLNPAAFDALDFAFADGVPNVIRRVVVLRGELWLVGDEGIEVWYNSGAADFPFRRRPGGVIPIGAETIKSLAVLDNSVFWLGVGGIIYRSDGYQPLRISTTGIEAAIRLLNLGTVVNALWDIQDGHLFYVINYQARSFAYDCATKRWAERSSSADGSARWRINCGVIVGERLFFGDNLSGRLLHPVPVGTEDGSAVIRQFTMPPVWGNTRRSTNNRLEIEMESGGVTPAGDVLLEWSDDGGLNWKGNRTMSAGAAAETRKRVFTTRLGSFYQRVFRVTAYNRATFYAVDADIPRPAVGLIA